MFTPADPATFPNALLIESCDIPADMTIAEWRLQRRAVAPGPHARRRLRLALRPRR